MTPPKQRSWEVSEELLLDVGISVFEANVPQDYDEQIKQNIQPEVRRAEGNYMAYFLKNLMQSTGNWGAVRVIPRATNAVDVTIFGRIKHSDGESATWHARAVDARGVKWFEKDYEALASKYAYGQNIPRGIDPFQSAYTALSDDLLVHLKKLSNEDIQAIRTTAEMKFARDLSPDAFSEYVVKSRSGTLELRRLPAKNDPMLGRVRRVREREYLFIDTLDEYYATFSTQMFKPYHDWRRATYDEAIAYKRLKEQSKARLIAGTVAIAGGIAGQASANAATYYGGAIGIVGGAGLVQSGIEKRAEAQMHADVLQELGVSAEAEISPHTIELENQTLTLQGNVETQYEELRRILRKIYYEELGLDPPSESKEKGSPIVDSTAEKLDDAI